jgi:hypothetical protein
VIGAKVFSRKGADKDSRTELIEKAEEVKLRKDEQDEIRIIRNSAIGKLKKLLVGKTAAVKLEGKDGNIAWNKRTGALPARKSAETDPFYADPKFKGWFEELADKDVHPTVMPTHLEEFAFFKDSLVIKTSQEALLGDRSPEDLAKEWADYMTKAQQKFLAAQ